jgi:4'-phosphopantetheinyl transferase
MLIYLEKFSDANQHRYGADLLDRLEITDGRVWFYYTAFEKRQQARRAARVFLKQILARCTGRNADAIHFTENRYGKPALARGITDLPICFNLSHSGPVVVCALTLAHDIGVDIEDMQRAIDLSIADRFFSNPEAQAIAQAPPFLKQSLFFKFWTLKEACVKATGRGLATGIDQFSFVLDRPEIQVRFHGSGPGQDHSGHWQFFQFSPVSGYMAAVAVNKKTGPPLTLSVHHWVWD